MLFWSKRVASTWGDVTDMEVLTYKCIRTKKKNFDNVQGANIEANAHPMSKIRH